MKKTVISIFCALLAAGVVFTCASCGDSTHSDTTVVDTEPAEPETELRAEDISYPDETLPVVHISTADGFQVTSKDEYTACNIRFELNDRYSSYTSTFTDGDGGDAEIRCRGNASYTNPEMREKNKYSYKVKLSKKANVLGLGESKHWYLINNWRDVSNLRHKLAYDLAGALGLAHTDCTWVNVYYNGEYRGLYLLTESIRVAEDRVDTFNWEEFCEDIAEKYASDCSFSEADALSLDEALKNDLSWITSAKYTFVMSSGEVRALDFSQYYDPKSLDMTTGYLIEYCTSYESDGTKWKTDKTIPLIMDNPKMLHTNPEMYDYVHTLVQDFEDAVCSPTFHNSNGKHYSEYADVNSLVDYWMVWNFLCNNEFGARSIYFYIEDGKMVFGPIWDFDQTIGNAITVVPANHRGNYWVHDKKNAWFQELFGDPYFTALCQERWYSIREIIDDLINSVDIYADYIGKDAEACYERNGVRYYTIRNPEINNGQSMSPSEDFAMMRKWLRDRVEWIDENFRKIAPNVDNGGYTRSGKLTCTLYHDGKLMELDLGTVHGTPADFVLSPDATGTLRLKLTTTDSKVKHTTPYLNATCSLGKKTLTSSKSAEYTIDLSLLDMRDGAKNVIYVPAFKSDGSLRIMSSVVIRVTSDANPREDEKIIQLGTQKYTVKTGETFTFPEITEKKSGYLPLGWTDGSDEVYKAGVCFEVKHNSYYFIRWVRTDALNTMH